jgi:FAD-dependent oxidoreductase domain-containing protein 1
MSESCDVAIVGGGVVGSAIAYFLLGQTSFKGRVTVIEKDSTYADAATSRSVGGVRQQFSTPENIAMSSFGAAFIKGIANYLTVDGEAPTVPFTEWGYLFLASESGLDILTSNHATQTRLGADIALLTRDQLKAQFPWLNVGDLAAGSFGRTNEGWTDPYGLLQAFKRKARSLGAVYLNDEAVAIERAGGRIAAVQLAKAGRLACGNLVDSAGYHSHRIAAMAGIELPVRPRKRCVFVFDCKTPIERSPLTIDPTGVYFRPEGASFICGVAPPDERDPDCLDFNVDYSLFEETIWPTLAERVPAFEAIKLARAWVGHYDYNTVDQNAILGRHPEVANFFFASGFSGHGLQQSPAVGRATAEMIAYDAYRSIDLTRFGFERFSKGRPIIELNVV